MSEQEEFEVNFPAQVKGKKNKDDTWDAVITRKIENKTFPVTVLKNLGATDCYVRLGVKVPEKEVPFLEGIEKARAVLGEALTSLKYRSVVTGSEVHDVLLDAMNELGWGEDKEQVATDDDG